MGQHPIIRKDKLGRWWCVTDYHATEKGTVFTDEAHEITSTVEGIVQSNLIAASMNAWDRRN